MSKAAILKRWGCPHAGGSAELSFTRRGGFPMVDPTIVTAVRNYLRTLRAHGVDVRFGIVFGSWAQGKANVWSDIDLVVVSSRFDYLRNRQDVDMLWRLAARCDSRLAPGSCVGRGGAGGEKRARFV